MDVKELKKELSKVAGVDFFNPKYRAIFKRFADEYKPAEAEESDDMEEAKAEDAQTDEAVQETAAEVTEDIAEDKAADEAGEQPDYAKTDKDETALEQAVEDDKKADADVQEAEAKADDAPEAEKPAEEPPKAVATVEESTAEQSAASMGDELLTTKLELELVRAGIREDRLETAKRLFMPEFKSSGGNVEQIRALIAQYPEWLGQKGGAAGFGMPLGDNADGLTNEEKALKRLGIDPRG